MKSRLPQIIYTLTAILTAGTVATTILYQSTSKEILLTLAITFGTCAYHFIMRLLVGSIVNSILHNKVDCCKRWFQVSESEKKIYEKLGVKKWKNKMPTYRPDWFDPRLHSWKEIAQTMCQSEVGHEIIAVLSFLPVIVVLFFFITSIVSAGMDLIFVIMQRYNRQRIMRILAAKK